MPRSRALKPSLVAVLCTLLALDLAARRLLWPLVRTDLLLPAGTLRDGLDFAALFAANAATVLGIPLAFLGLGRLLVMPTVIPRGAKAAVGALAMAFMPLLALAAWRPLPSVLGIYLQASYTCLFFLVMLGGMLLRSKLRTRLGLLMMALPSALYLPYGVAAIHGGHGHEGLISTTAQTLLHLGELAAVVAAAASAALFLPRRPRVVVPSLAAGALVAAAGWLCMRDWELAHRLAAGGLGLDLPLHPAAVALYLAALGAFAFTAAALVATPGPSRLRGYGLLLVGLAGFRLDSPAQYAASMVGMLCLVESVVRELPAASRATVEAWQALVRRAAEALGAPEVEMAGREGYETARVRLTRGDVPIELAIGREAGRLAHGEVVVGHAPSEEAPPVALLRRGAPKLGRTRGDEVATGDLAFDEAFRIFDARQLSARDRVLDDDLRPRLVHRLDGWLGVWPGEGARYRTRETTLFEGALDEKLPGLVDLLLDLKSRS